MAYKECPRCHQIVSEIYNICPNCYTSLESTNSKKKRLTQSQRRTIKKIAIILPIVLTVVLLLLIGRRSSQNKTTSMSSFSSASNSSKNYTTSSDKKESNSSTDISDDLQAGLAVYAEQKVRAHLLSPSTAKFPLYSKYTYRKEGNVYTISGYVDAKNYFGTELRKKWGVMVEYDGTYSMLICVVIDGETYFD